MVPVLVGPDDDAFRLSSLMHRAGVYVPPVVFPAVPRGESRLRFCVISEHRQDEMVKALDLLEKVAAENGIVLPRRDY